ncbi:DUF6957 family protein [Halomonas heilongjiangensis]|uniref:DUF6957 domain-containing protein n=1 Tax=Halomonas heilongjiangensis TaxID=1387883 RepID=A0A2N7TU73_9GAMM|nr:hypothetical protein [Halomonas heilongjiangensis]PMR71740.1 hypothetical protein C1H66_01500 [Halomonas heilongjiangensis]PXX89979.1 hypothetical protein CR158_10380 [Halomonas heilongjiangensis]
MILTQEDRKKEEDALRERYRDKYPAEDLEQFIQQLCQVRVIRARETWEVESESDKKASVVRAWEIVNVIDADTPMKFLFSDEVVSDYKCRFARGDYVFTSLIIHFDEETGLVQTGNSLYCLSGDGEEVNATLREAYNMRTLGQSLHMLRAVERDLGPNSAITGPDKDD